MYFKTSLIGLLLLLLFVSVNVSAQCPVPNSCTPGAAPSANNIFGMGIFSVSIGGVTSLTNATNGAADGYQDYSCTKQATVLEGVNSSISVFTNPNATENVRVWLDLNNNGIFEAASELIFSSNNAKTHTGTFFIPVSASVVKNTVLRLRIAADNFSSALPTPCSTPVYSQTEDYGITVAANTSKPIVNFTVDKPITCSPTVQFTQQTLNGATSNLWSFGDNTTSTLANPSHTYALPGVYTVKLKACNNFGCDSLEILNYITYHTNIPVPATCTPVTSNYCCGYGITSFTLGSLFNTSQDGSVGYEDFTCTKSATVQAGTAYNIALTTNPTLQQDSWIYLDANNNGSFEASELLYTKLNTINPTGSITIPSTTFLNTPLRLRVISDFAGSSSDPCLARTHGQAEDYTIKIIPNLLKPAPEFTSNNSSPCDSIIQFTDTSLNLPTSWLWNFGDGFTSTLQNPVHKYTSAGIYTVKLKVCNANGCDSLTKTNYITLTKPCANYCLPSGTSNNFWISNVTLNTINNTTAATTGGYISYTNISTNLVKGTVYPLSVNTNVPNPHTIAVWFDLNKDGDFLDAGERIAFGSGFTGVFNGSITIPATSSLGITRMRVMARGGATVLTPCLTNQMQFETEDYTVNISQLSGLRESEFASAVTIYPNPNHGTFSLQMPGVFKADYNLEVRDLAGKTVAKQTLKVANGNNQQVNFSQLPKGIYLLRLFSSESTVVRKIIIE